MGNFKNALQIVLRHEGGYGNDPDDPGGETYKGIARKIWSKWDGWVVIDLQKKNQGFPKGLDSDVGLQEKVEHFYQVEFWDKVMGDKITNDEVATSIFDFAVNAGVKVSSILAQQVVEATADGTFGDQSVSKINAFDPEHFLAAFTVAKIARYISIVNKRPVSRKYFFGWVSRALND